MPNISFFPHVRFIYHRWIWNQYQQRTVRPVVDVDRWRDVRGFSNAAHMLAFNCHFQRCNFEGSVLGCTDKNTPNRVMYRSRIENLVRPCILKDNRSPFAIYKSMNSSFGTMAKPRDGCQDPALHGDDHLSSSTTKSVSDVLKESVKKMNDMLFVIAQYRRIQLSWGTWPNC